MFSFRELSVEEFVGVNGTANIARRMQSNPKSHGTHALRVMRNELTSWARMAAAIAIARITKNVDVRVSAVVTSAANKCIIVVMMAGPPPMTSNKGASRMRRIGTESENQQMRQLHASSHRTPTNANFRERQRPYRSANILHGITRMAVQCYS